MKSLAYFCSYAPLPIISACGLQPVRLLPTTDAPEAAGQWLHDNMCPHVKKILDRALSDDLPELAGILVVNSCDPMRRLADAWRLARPGDMVVQLDLPAVEGEQAARTLAGDLESLSDVLCKVGGTRPDIEQLRSWCGYYNRLSDELQRLRRLYSGRAGATETIQSLVNMASEGQVDKVMDSIEDCEKRLAGSPSIEGHVQVVVFGNVMPQPEAFRLFEESGLSVVADDLCTGSRQFQRYDFDNWLDRADGDPWLALASALLSRRHCARTMSSSPGAAVRSILELVNGTEARGAIAHVMKFCDPYLSRLPSIVRALRDEGIPVLVLDADATMRSLGQQKTRLQAFSEMTGSR